MITRIINTVRGLIQDSLKTKTDVYVYTSSAVFTLLENNVSSVTQVIVNGAVLSASNWSFSSTTNQVTITSSLSANDVVQIQYSYYCLYSDTAIKNTIDAALAHISVHNVADFTYDSSNLKIYPYPNKKQENLIAMIIGIILAPNYTQYKFADVTETYDNRKYSIDEKITRQIINYKHNKGIFFIV